MGIGLGKIINRGLEKFGYQLHKKQLNNLVFPIEASPEELKIMNLVLKPREGRIGKDALTMVSIERLWQQFQL